MEYLEDADITINNPRLNCLFKENKASKYGTMQFIYGQVRMKNITLQNNYCSYKNEGIVAIYARLSI